MSTPRSIRREPQLQAETLREQLRAQMGALQEARAELEKSRQRCADLFDFAPVNYLTLDREGRICEINLPGSSLLGESRQRLLAAPLSAFIQAEDRPLFLRHMERCNAGEFSAQTELRIQRKQGLPTPVQISSNPAARSATRFRTILVDLTERKRLESEDHRLQKRAAALRKANRALAKEIARRSQLHADLLNLSESEKRRVGNQMRDGLCQDIAAASIYCNVALKRMELSRQDSEDLQVINDLLGSILTEANEVARELNPVHLDEVGLTVALEQLSRIANSSIPCEFHNPMRVWVADNAVAMSLYRIAQDAVAHALKHPASKRMLIRLSRKCQRVVLEIEDEGNATPPEAIRLMDYHAKNMGASLRISRRPRAGTKIACSVRTPILQALPSE